MVTWHLSFLWRSALSSTVRGRRDGNSGIVSTALTFGYGFSSAQCGVDGRRDVDPLPKVGRADGINKGGNLLSCGFCSPRLRRPLPLTALRTWTIQNPSDDGNRIYGLATSPTSSGQCPPRVFYMCLNWNTNLQIVISERLHNHQRKVTFPYYEILNRISGRINSYSNSTCPPQRRSGNPYKICNGRYHLTKQQR